MTRTIRDRALNLGMTVYVLWGVIKKKRKKKQHSGSIKASDINHTRGISQPKG